MRCFFVEQIEECWSEHFASSHSSGIEDSKIDTVMQNLVMKLKSRKLVSPGIPGTFRDFIVRQSGLIASGTICRQELFWSEPLALQDMK